VCDVLPLTAVEIFYVVEEVERAARSTPDNVSKVHQFLALGHWRVCVGKFNAGERLVHGLLLRFDEHHGQTIVGKFRSALNLNFFES
jgi:hypothetical protein